MWRWLKKRRLKAEIQKLQRRVLDEDEEQDNLVVSRWVALQAQDAHAYDAFSGLLVHSLSTKRNLLTRHKDLVAQLERL
jgi:hypothetical protein